LAIEGIARISGDAVERNEILEKDENDVPKILTMIYHELFPTFFLLSKSLNVASPPHTIGEMGNSPIKSENQVSSNENSNELPEDLLESSSESPPETTSTSAESTEPVAESLENPDISQPSV